MKSLATAEATKTVVKDVDAATTVVTAPTTPTIAEAAVATTEVEAEPTTTTTEKSVIKSAKSRMAAVLKNSAKPLSEPSSRNMSNPKCKREKVQKPPTHSALTTVVAVATTRAVLTEATPTVDAVMVSTVEVAVAPEATITTIAVAAAMVSIVEAVEADMRTIATTTGAGRSLELTNVTI